MREIILQIEVKIAVREECYLYGRPGEGVVTMFSGMPDTLTLCSLSGLSL